MATITIPRTIAKAEKFVIIPRKEYDRFLRLEKNQEKEKVTEDTILRWSQEARKLHKAGKLRLFENLIKQDYSKVAKKYKLD